MKAEVYSLLGGEEAGMEGRQGVPSQGMGTSLNITPPMPARRSTWVERAALASLISLNCMPPATPASEHCSAC